jgi:putative protease
MKGHILHSPQPGSVQEVVGHISPEDLLKTIHRAPH